MWYLFWTGFHLFTSGVFMNLVSFLLSLSPVALLAVLAVGLKQPALRLSLYGVIYTGILAFFTFKTPLRVILWAVLDGVLSTIPLLLVVLAGILLSNLLLASGSLSRLVAAFLPALGHPRQRHLFIALGACNFLEGASIIAEPLVAPMLWSAGVAPAGAAALSIMGYAGMMSVEMAGIIITVLALVTGLPQVELAKAAAWLSVPATLALAAALPMYLPKEDGGLLLGLQTLASALLISLVALITTMALDVTLAGMTGGLALMAVLLVRGCHRLTGGRQIVVDLAPFLLILIPLLLVNTVPHLRTLTLHYLVIEFKVIPVHRITLTPFFSAYLYLFLALGLALFLFRQKVPVSGVLTAGLRQAWRALASMALFGAMGQIIAFSGYGEGFGQLDKTHNIPWVLAMGLKNHTGQLYPLFVPLLGWVGTFLTGYGVASLMLFGELQVHAARLLGKSAVWLAAGLSVGASVGSISSPFKIAIATPMCGALGLEGEILRRTIPLGLAASFLLGLILWLL